MTVPFQALSGPDTNPDLVLGLVILALILVGQARTRLWAADRNSPLPLILVALGLLIYFGYRSSVGPLSSQQQEYLFVTLAFGIVFGALRARTIMMWKDTAGLCVRGTPGTLVLWVLTVLGMGLYYGFGNITYAGFVLYLGITFAAQQLFVIVRGVRASRSLARSASPAASAGTTSGGAADRAANGAPASGARAVPTDSGTAAHLS